MAINTTRFRQILREEAKKNLLSSRKPLYESINGRSFLIIENLSSAQLTDKMRSKEGKEEIKKSLWEKFRDSSAVDIGLDILGLLAGDAAKFLDIPTGGLAEVVAMVPDLLNATRKFARGDKFGGTISLICAVPFAGDLFANFLEAEKLGIAGAKATAATVRSISAFFKEHGAAAKKVSTSVPAIMKVVAEHFPAAAEHHQDITNTISAFTSGDEEKIKKIAIDSGAKIVAREINKKLNADDASDRDSGNVSESLSRAHNRKFHIVMGR